MGMTIRQAIEQLVNSTSLTAAQMADVMRQIMTGGATDAQIGALLVALRIKGETVAEITGAVSVMRELVIPVEVQDPHLVDIVGTGGDGAGIFNVSTASAFVAAAAGAKVAKHGNRSVSSKSGAADLLEAAGVNLDLNPRQIARSVTEIGIGFMFAVNHHQAMKYAIGPRKEIGIRTLFNLLGPLTNPAGVKKQLLGVFSRHWLRPVAEVLRDLGSEHVLVVCSEEGLDEISVAAPTHVAELHNGVITEYQITPAQFGIEQGSLDSLKVSDSAASLAIIEEILAGNEGPGSDIVALNAGAAIYAADVADSLEQGVAIAQDVLASGLAGEKLHELVEFSQLQKVIG